MIYLRYVRTEYGGWKTVLTARKTVQGMVLEKNYEGGRTFLVKQNKQRRKTRQEKTIMVEEMKTSK
jgi:hypothetical protein